MYKCCIIIFGAILLISCSSNIKTEVFLTDESGRNTLSDDVSFYLENYTLDFDKVLQPAVDGDGALIILKQLLTKQPDSNKNTTLFEVRDNIEYRLYFQIKQPVQPDSINLFNISLCNVIGNYNIAADLRQYICRDGYLLIDSVKSSRIFGRFNGNYYNYENNVLQFEGRFNAVRRDHLLETNKKSPR